jgi:hypothetical protein
MLVKSFLLAASPEKPKFTVMKCVLWCENGREVLQAQQMDLWVKVRRVELRNMCSRTVVSQLILEHPLHEFCFANDPSPPVQS